MCKLQDLDLEDPSGVAALLDDWREKLAANPHKATETDSPTISREEWVDNNMCKLNLLSFIPNYSHKFNGNTLFPTFLKLFQRYGITMWTLLDTPCITTNTNYYALVELQLQYSTFRILEKKNTKKNDCPTMGEFF